MSYKYIPVSDDVLLKIMQMQHDTDIDSIDTLINGALNCLAVYLDDEIVRTIVDDYYEEDGDEYE